jgi:hypothetical protein
VVPLAGARRCCGLLLRAAAAAAVEALYSLKITAMSQQL